MTAADSPRGRRMPRAHRIARRFMWIGASIALSCGKVTETVDGGVASVAVTPLTSTISVGSQLPLQATLQDAAGRPVTGASIVWSVKDPNIASVSAAGIVTGLAVGSTQVAASAGGQSAIAAITVTRVPVSAVIVQPKIAEVTAGGQMQLSATAYDASQVALSGRTITWSSSNESVATVNATTGMVTAVGVGVVTITATSEGRSDAATLTITRAPVATVVVTPDPLSMSVGQSTQLTATPRDLTGATLAGRATTWTSSNTNVATVTDQGVVRAVAVGTATITATIEGKTASATLTVSNFPVGSVSVAPLTSTLAPRASVQLTAFVRDITGAVANDRPVIWTSSNASVATVTQTGLVTAVAAGSATITATSEGQSGTASITVLAASIATLEITPPSATLTVQQTVALTVTAKDGEGVVLTGRPVAFASNNNAIATVSAAGVVTAVAPGTTSIVASSEGKTASMSLTVTATPVGSVTVTPATATVAPGGSTTLTATVRDGNGNVLTGRTVTWTTSNAGAATVSSTGVVTGVAAGSATITATSEGRSGSASVSVVPAAVGSVEVQPTTAAVIVGQTTTLTATTKDANGGVLTGRVITWSTNAQSIATVSSSGVVTGVAPGTATITATSEGKSASSTVTVTAAPVIPVATVTVTPNPVSIVQGTTSTLTATTRDANNNVLTGRTVTWTTSASGIATVSSTGVVTAVAPGTATITATSETKTGTTTVTVTPIPVATVTVSPSTASITVGGTTTLTATTRDANNATLTGRVVTWSSSNPLVATVSTTGVVTGVSAGSATITATSETKTGTSSITVTLVPVGSVTLTPASTNLVSGSTTTLTAVVRDQNGNILTDRTVTWTSSNESRATVSSTGVVTGLLVGNVTITASAGGRSDQTSVTVTVGPLATIRVTPSPTTVDVGGSRTLTAQGVDAAGNPIGGLSYSWSTSDPSIATVNGNGRVDGKKVGVVTITASSSGKSGTSVVTVTP